MTDDGDPDRHDELAELRSERFTAAQVEQKLRSELDRERARSASLERELSVVRASESFRLGHRLVWALERLPRRPAALRRWVFDRARRPSQEEDPGAPRLPEDGRQGVLFVAWGASEARLHEYVDRVARLEAQLVDLTPVFLVDSHALEPLRGTGWVVEYVVPLADWRRHRPAHEWGAYVTKRVATLSDRYELRTVVLLEEAGAVIDQGVLDGLLRPAFGVSEDNLLELE